MELLSPLTDDSAIVDGSLLSPFSDEGSGKTMSSSESSAPTEHKKSDLTEHKKSDLTEHKTPDLTDHKTTDPTDLKTSDPTDLKTSDPTDLKTTDPTDLKKSDLTEHKTTDPTDLNTTDLTEHKTKTLSSPTNEILLVDIVGVHQHMAEPLLPEIAPPTSDHHVDMFEALENQADQFSLRRSCSLAGDLISKVSNSSLTSILQS